MFSGATVSALVSRRGEREESAKLLLTCPVTGGEMEATTEALLQMTETSL